MPDTVRTTAALLGLFADGQPARSITPQDLRDFVVSTAAADTALDTRVDALEGAPGPDLSAYATDADVSAAVAAEATARANADAALDARVDTLEAATGPDLSGYVTDAELAVVADALDTETATRLSADTALDARLDVLETSGAAPSGAAGGVLSGTYPNPGFAADMATQAELDAAIATRAAAAHTHGVADLTATGTRDATTFLRGDNTWAVPPGTATTPTGSGDPVGYGWREHSIHTTSGGGSFTAVGVSFPSTNGTGSIQPDADGPWLRYTTGASVNNQAGLVQTQPVLRTWLPERVYRIKTDADLTNVSLWIGLLNSSTFGSANPAGSGDYAAFRYHTAADATAFWRAVTKDGTTINVTATAAPIAPNTVYTLRVTCSASDVKFYVDDALVATHTANLPTATTLLRGYVDLTTLTAAARSLRIGREWGRFK